MKDALLYLKAVPRQVPLIWFIGHPGRTWFVDQSDIANVLETLRSARMFHPVHTAGWGFDAAVSEMSRILGLVTAEAPSLSVDDEQRVSRDPDTVFAVDMIVAFPEEETLEPDRLGRPTGSVRKLGWETADPSLTNAISAGGVPVLVVYRTGETTWIRSSSAQKTSTHSAQ
jgi:hypothetical protein